MSKWISIQGDLYNIDCFQKIEMLRPDTDREDRWALRAFYIIREDGVYREEDYVDIMSYSDFPTVRKTYDDLVEALEAPEI